MQAKKRSVSQSLGKRTYQFWVIYTGRIFPPQAIQLYCKAPKKRELRF
jgi:hypothetical protein